MSRVKSSIGAGADGSMWTLPRDQWQQRRCSPFAKRGAWRKKAKDYNPDLDPDLEMYRTRVTADMMRMPTQ